MPEASRPIDTNDEGALRAWAEELDATPDQIREAVQAVGPQPQDVEAHLKGSRSTTNSDRVRETGEIGRRGDGSTRR